MTKLVDLTDAPVADAHCHGFRVEDLLAHDPDGWAERITLLGMCMASSATATPEMRSQASALTSDTVFAMTGRRWLANHLGVELHEVEVERHRRLADDAVGYVSSLLSSEHVTDLFVDDGYPRPVVDGGDLAALTRSRVSRVARIEILIEKTVWNATTFDDAVGAFAAALDEVGKDNTCIAYKTVIAYRTGLDIGSPTLDEARSSFEAYREAGWRDDRAVSKALRDHLLNLTCEKAAAQGRTVHIHSGAGDPDVALAHVRPTGLAPLIMRHPSTPIVLIHCGFPWIAEAAYLAGMYANAHVELSLFNPWSTLDLDRGLATVIGSVPTGKILYGSDEASEPEVLWIAARMFRAALTRVLSGAVDTDILTADEGLRVGGNLLAGNALRLHGLKP